MDTKQFFKDVYEDFFGVEKIKAENEKLAKELGLNQDYPTIELNKQDETKEELTEEKIKETKDEFMLKSFEKLEKLYITEQSKNTLKKIIEYKNNTFHLICAFIQTIKKLYMELLI